MAKHDHTAVTYLRFFHALPIQYSIDIYIDSKLVFRDILYEDFTEYITLSSGEHIIEMTRAKNSIVIFSTTWRIPNKKIYTSIIAPKTKEGVGIELYKMEDVIRTIPSNNCLVRFGCFSMTSPPADVFLSDGTPLFKKVSCSEMTNYTSLSPSIYSLEIKDSKTDQLLTSAHNLRLKTTRYYSLFIIGNNTKEFPFILILSLDGNSYLKI